MIIRSFTNKALAYLLAVFLPIQGSSAMAHDDVLKFSSHDLGIHCYSGVRDVKVVYAASGHDLCTDKPAREKAGADEGK